MTHQGWNTFSICRSIPFKEYHTDKDNLGSFDKDKAEETISLFIDAVDIFEHDYIPVQNIKSIYLTRFNLYSDWTTNREQYDLKIVLIESMWEGLSVFDISIKYNLDMSVNDFFRNSLNLN